MSSTASNEDHQENGHPADHLARLKETKENESEANELNFQSARPSNISGSTMNLDEETFTMDDKEKDILIDEWPEDDLVTPRYRSQRSTEDSDATFNGETTAPSTISRTHGNSSNGSPSLLRPLQRLLSPLTRPFTTKGSRRHRRNRRTQTDTESQLSSRLGLTVLPRRQSLRRAQTFVSTSSPSSSGGGLKYLVRRLRLPLALVCFVLFFVIQFRANSRAYEGTSNALAPAATYTRPLYLSSTNESLSTDNVILNRDLQAVPGSLAVSEATGAPPTPPTPTFLNASALSDTRPPCPLVPPHLVGRLKVLRSPPPMPELEAALSGVQVGGHFTPPDCAPKDKVAIIIPYRDRDEHLRTFLYNAHPMLMRQNIEYGLYIVEQSGSDRFNRAKLMNIGFLEALKHYDYDCFIFHDVDLIPEDDRNIYSCPQQPRHMSVAIDKFKYRLPYKDLFGGVSALTREQFLTVNGFSNEFWGWGGEDDDMSNRVRHYHFKISRYPADIARYTMLKHEQDVPNADRYKKLYNGWRRFETDGVKSTKYAVLDTTYRKLYTSVLVDVLPPPLAKKKPSSSFRRHALDLQAGSGLFHRHYRPLFPRKNKKPSL